MEETIPWHAAVSSKLSELRASGERLFGPLDAARQQLFHGVRAKQDAWEACVLQRQWGEHITRHVEALQLQLRHRGEARAAEGNGDQIEALGLLGSRVLGDGRNARSADAQLLADAQEKGQGKKAGLAGGNAAYTRASESAAVVGDSGHATVQELYVARPKHYIPNVFTFGYSFKAWTEYWALLSTGELYLGLPHGDPRKFDFTTDRRNNPHRFVPLRHDNGTSHEFEYEGCPVTLRAGQDTVHLPNNTVFRKVQPCTDGCTLDGDYVHEAAKDFVDAAEASGVKGVTRISFRPDGTFFVKGGTGILPCQEDKLVEVTGEAKGAQGEEEDEERSGRGQYEIWGNGIELRYESGRVEDAFFFRYPSGVEWEEASININGTTYHHLERSS